MTKETFVTAQDRILGELQTIYGWTVGAQRGVRWAENQSKRLRLWFKPKGRYGYTWYAKFRSTNSQHSISRLVDLNTDIRGAETYALLHDLVMLHLLHADEIHSR